jgi:hypothetical protein
LLQEKDFLPSAGLGDVAEEDVPADASEEMVEYFSKREQTVVTIDLREHDPRNGRLSTRLRNVFSSHLWRYASSIKICHPFSTYDHDKPHVELVSHHEVTLTKHERTSWKFLSVEQVIIKSSNGDQLEEQKASLRRLHALCATAPTHRLPTELLTAKSLAELQAHFISPTKQYIPDKSYPLQPLTTACADYWRATNGLPRRAADSMAMEPRHETVSGDWVDHDAGMKNMYLD